MKSSLEAFMKGLIDYMGFANTAMCSLDEAIQCYASHHRNEDAWMLSRFLVPADRMEELEPYHDNLFVNDKFFDFSILGKSTDTVAEFEKEIGIVLDRCEQFQQRYGNLITTDRLEINLPKEVMFSSDIELVEVLLNKTALQLSQSSGTPVQIFYEPILSESWEKELDPIMRAIAKHNKTEARHIEHYQHAGFKLHCGSMTASTIPSSEQVAFVLKKAREYNVAVKFATGLHCPIRYYDESVQAKRHGFINVIGGALLSYAHDLTNEVLVQILEEEDDDQFLFTDEALSWKDYPVFTGEIIELREVALISYESFDLDASFKSLQRPLL